MNKGFKHLIKRFVAVFASREFAFIYCVLGTIGQIAHCYYLVNSVSSFDGGIRTAQAIILSTFISSSLLYFVAIADREDPDYKRVMRAVNMFMIIEITINVYYYGKHLLLGGGEIRIFDFVFATIISAILPITIKLYANSIMAKKWLQEIDAEKMGKNQGDTGDVNTSDNIVQNNEEVREIVDNAVSDIKNNIRGTIEEIVENVIDTHFENNPVDINVESIINNVTESVKNEIKKDLKNDLKKDIDIDDEIIKPIVEDMVDNRIKEMSKMLDTQIDNKVNHQVSQQMNKIVSSLPIRSVIDGQIKSL